jgi:hypothetical protein
MHHPLPSWKSTAAAYCNDQVLTSRFIPATGAYLIKLWTPPAFPKPVFELTPSFSEESSSVSLFLTPKLALVAHLDQSNLRLVVKDTSDFASVADWTFTVEQQDGVLDFAVIEGDNLVVAINGQHIYTFSISSKSLLQKTSLGSPANLELFGGKIWASFLDTATLKVFDVKNVDAADEYRAEGIPAGFRSIWALSSPKQDSFQVESFTFPSIDTSVNDQEVELKSRFTSKVNPWFEANPLIKPEPGSVPDNHIDFTNDISVWPPE